jgi:hypothetical protein
MAHRLVTTGIVHRTLNLISADVLLQLPDQVGLLGGGFFYKVAGGSRPSIC